MYTMMILNVIFWGSFVKKIVRNVIHLNGKIRYITWNILQSNIQVRTTNCHMQIAKFFSLTFIIGIHFIVWLLQRVSQCFSCLFYVFTKFLTLFLSFFSDDEILLAFNLDFGFHVIFNSNNLFTWHYLVELATWQAWLWNGWRQFQSLLKFSEQLV